MYNKVIPTIIFFFSCLYTPNLNAEKAELVMMTKLELPEVEFIGRTVECQSWKVDGVFYFDSPDKFDFFVNSSYRILLEFSANDPKGTINHKNFEKKGYSIEIVSSNPDHFLPSGLFTEKEGAYFLLQSGNLPNTLATLNISLISNSTKERHSIAQFEMQLKPPPSAENPYTNWLPYKYNIFPAQLKFVDQANPKNVLNVDATYPSYVVLDKSKQYTVFVELKKVVEVSGKKYETNINYKNDLGYRVDLSWGDQRPHPLAKVSSKNGFRNNLNLKNKETKPNQLKGFLVPRTNVQISQNLYTQALIPKKYPKLNLNAIKKASKKRTNEKLKKAKKINTAFITKQSKRPSKMQLQNKNYISQNYKVYAPYAKKLSTNWNSNIKLVNPPKSKPKQNLLLAQPLIQMQLAKPNNQIRHKKPKNPERFSLILSINNPFSEMENIKEIELIIVDPKK